MSTSQATSTEIDRYLAAIQARLADVPEAEEMIEDLRQHLAEVAAEGEGSLEERLGSPGSYAEELRASAGLGAPPSTFAALARRLPGAGLNRRIHGAVVRWRDEPRVAAARELAGQMRPAWWVLRGYLIVLSWSVANEPWSLLVFPWPRLAGRRTLGLVAAALVVAASVWLGRREARSRRLRWAGIALTLLTLMMTTAMFSQIRATAARPVFYPGDTVEEDFSRDGALAHPDGRPITNLYPYGPDGEPLDGVLLYDQEGQPVDLVLQYGPEGPLVTSYPVDEQGQPVTNVFPKHQAYRSDPGSTERHGAAPERPHPSVPALRGQADGTSTTGPTPDVSPEPTTEPSVEPSPHGTTSPTEEPSAPTQ